MDRHSEGGGAEQECQRNLEATEGIRPGDMLALASLAMTV